MGVIAKRKRGKKGLYGWKDEYYLQAYELARDGLQDRAIAMALGVSRMSFKSWIKRLPALAAALEKARGTKSGVDTFQDYVYGRLPHRLKEFWKKIQDTNNPKRLMDRISILDRMQLFLYAYISSNFTLTKACQRLGLHVGIPNRWIENYPQFSELMKGLHDCKKDFFEGALIKLVRSGDTAAILFANRTLNRDRGYNDKVEVVHSGEIGHKVKLDDMEIPLEVRLAWREAKRRKGQQLALPAPDDAVDAEFEVVKKEKAS